MDCRKTPAINFKTRLGFNQHDPIMTQEQSTKIRSVFSIESIIFQYHVLTVRIDVYFLKHKLAIEIEELGHSTRDIEFELERKKSIKKRT